MKRKLIKFALLWSENVNDCELLKNFHHLLPATLQPLLCPLQVAFVILVSSLSSQPFLPRGKQ